MIATQPSIWLLGIRVDEPVTLITNLIVTSVCIYAYFRVNRNLEVSKFQRFIKYYFLTLGIAIGLGGIFGHAFLYALSTAWKLPGWLLSIISMTLMERAIIEKSKFLLSEKLHGFLIWATWVKLVVFMFLTVWSIDFVFVGFHSTLAMDGTVASCSLFTSIKTKSLGSKLYVVGVLVSAFSGIVFVNRWGFHIWFNHVDISHIFMAIGAYFFYQATVQLKIKMVDGVMEVEA